MDGIILINKEKSVNNIRQICINTSYAIIKPFYVRQAIFASLTNQINKHAKY